MGDLWVARRFLCAIAEKYAHPEPMLLRVQEMLRRSAAAIAATEYANGAWTTVTEDGPLCGRYSVPNPPTAAATGGIGGVAKLLLKSLKSLLKVLHPLGAQYAAGQGCNLTSGPTLLSVRLTVSTPVTAPFAR